MQVGSIDQLMSQGNIETTGQNTDIAIQGDSFFVVRKGNQNFYTRAGNFQLDADGKMVSPANGFVLVFAAACISCQKPAMLGVPAGCATRLSVLPVVAFFTPLPMRSAATFA